MLYFISIVVFARGYTGVKMKKNPDKKLNSGMPSPIEENEDSVLVEEDIAGAIDQSVLLTDEGESAEETPRSFTKTSTRTTSIIDSTIMAFGQKSAGKGGTKTQIDRFYPDVESGLSNEQVGIRMAQGLNNVSKMKKGNTYKNIFFTNIFTFFNMLILAVFIAMIVFMENIQEVSKLFFMAIALANVSIGIIQEIKSKRATDKLKLVNAPVAVVVRGGQRISVPVGDVVLDDVIYYEMGKQICTDSIVASGEVEVNEALLTGESEPVLKRKGDQLFSGSFIVSGSCYARVDKVGSDNYVEKLTSYARKYKKPQSEMKNSITTVIKWVSCFIVPIAIILLSLGLRNVEEITFTKVGEVVQKVSGAIIGMIPAGMFLLTSIALAQSVLRLSKKEIVVKDLYCIEMLARVNVLCLDKTGTITDGTMRVASVDVLGKDDKDYSVQEIIGSMLTATDDNNMTALALADKFGYSRALKPETVMPFSSQKKLSAVTFEGAGTYVLGAPEFVMRGMNAKIERQIYDYAAAGMRVIMLAHSPVAIKNGKIPSVVRPVCLIALEDHIRQHSVDVINWFKSNGVAIKIISGDNPVTVAEVAKRVGVENADKYISLDGLTPQQVQEAAKKYTVFGRVSPDQKCLLIRALKRDGNNVAMTGDGVNDILAMRESDCAIAMGSGSEAARNVCHLLLSNSSFEAMPDVVKEGRRVVNNVQKSSSLYLMKTMMSIMLSIISVVLALVPGQTGNDIYFFDTSNLLCLELFIIGIPSVLLATQSNNNIIEGKFLANVFRKSAPGGIALVATVMAIYVFNKTSLVSLSAQEYTTMLVVGTTFAGFFSLLQICEPFDNSFKIVMCTAVGVIAFLALTGLVWLFQLLGINLFGDMVPLFDLTFDKITLLLSIVLSSYFVTAITDAILGATVKRKKPQQN